MTKVSENKPTPNLLSTNLKENSKLIKKSVDQSKINGYYMQGLYKTFMKKGNDYFSNLYRVHFNQSLQFLNVKKGLNLHGYVPNGKVAFIPGGNWCFKNLIMVKTPRAKRLSFSTSMKPWYIVMRTRIVRVMLGFLLPFPMESKSWQVSMSDHLPRASSRN